jgi:hypothetical protein
MFLENNKKLIGIDFSKERVVKKSEILERNECLGQEMISLFTGIIFFRTIESCGYFCLQSSVLAPF